MRFSKIILLGLLASLSLTFFAYAFDSGDGNDWPKFRGQNQDGKATETNIFNFDGTTGLKLAWKKPLGSGYSSISIADGRAVTMFSDSTFDYIIAFDANNGTELWRHKIDSTYLGHDGSHNGPISTPVIDGGKVFVLHPKGHLISVSASTGKPVWSTHIVKDHGALSPVYGFSTSPHVNGDVLILETGGPNKTISGFNKDTGKLLWAAGPDTVNYQSPLTVNLMGERQLLCVGDKYLIGLEPESGKKLWEFHHKGGNQYVNPVIVGDDRIFLRHKSGESILIQIHKEGNEFQVKELWTSKAFQFSYYTSIYHDGYIYGYSGSFLTCIDAKTGKKVWKSRSPGDGFPIMVDGHLVIQTKKGTIHIAQPSPDGYEEVASLKVFEGLTWTPPSFANGRIYVRNLYEIASVELAKVDQPMMVETPKRKQVAPNSNFAQFVKKVSTFENKKALLDEFMESQTEFPIIEGDNLVHFVFRGEAKDVAIAGDLVDFQKEEVLEQIKGTDFFHISYQLEPDARVNYRFTKDLEENIPDPRNSRKVSTVFMGPMSEVSMPEWKKASHLADPTGAERGRIDTLKLESKILEGTRKLDVYLPFGYDKGSRRYPVVYVNAGSGAQRLGNMTNSLDNLTGKSISPVIVVYVHANPNPQISFREFTGNMKEKYSQMFAEELVPFIDKKYRTLTNAGSRAVQGAGIAGYATFYTAFKYPQLFGKAAAQSAYMVAPLDQELKDLLSKSDKKSIQIYLDWGKYDLRSKVQGWSVVQDCRVFSEFLNKEGYALVGGEANNGFGWPNWRNRTDKILEMFFPLQKTIK